MREISLNILDIAQNAIAADAALIEISLVEDTARGTLMVTVADNGRGMSKRQLERVADPFYTTRTTRRVGLGLPLFKMACNLTGGSLEITSEIGRGTTVRALFYTGHIDAMPLGNIEDTIHTLVVLNGKTDFIYTRESDGRKFTMDTREFREVLGDIPFDRPEVSEFIRSFLKENSPAPGENL